MDDFDIDSEITTENYIDDPVPHAVLNRIKHDVLKVDRISDIDAWYRSAGPLLKTMSSFASAFETFKWHLLWQHKKRWDDLPDAVTAPYYGLFDVFVVNKTGVTSETARSYFRAIETFFGDDAPTPPYLTVEVATKDDSGVVVIDPVTKLSDKTRQEWEPHRVGITKLVLLRSALERGYNRQKLWDMAADPEVASTALRAACYKEDGQRPVLSSLRFNLYGPVITVTDGTWTSEIAEINWALFEEDEFSKAGILRLIRLLSIALDEDVIAKQLTITIAERLHPNADNKTE